MSNERPLAEVQTLAVGEGSWPELHSCSFPPTSGNATVCSPEFFLRFSQRFSTSVALFSLWRLYCVPESPHCVTNSLCCWALHLTLREPQTCTKSYHSSKVKRGFFTPCLCHPQTYGSLYHPFRRSHASGSIRFSHPLHVFFLVIFWSCWCAHTQNCSAKASNSAPECFKLPSTFLFALALGGGSCLCFGPLFGCLHKNLLWLSYGKGSGCNHHSPWGWRQTLMALLKLGQSCLPILGHWKVAKTVIKGQRGQKTTGNLLPCTTSHSSAPADSLVLSGPLLLHSFSQAEAFLPDCPVTIHTWQLLS